MKKQIIRLTENDLHNIILSSVHEIINEENLHEGWKNKLGAAALGATMSLSPLSSHAQDMELSNNSNKIERVVDSESANFIASEINKNTLRNKRTIRAVEQLMQQDESVADVIYQIAFMDEYDNFITLDNKTLKHLSTDDYNILSQEMEKEELVKITYFDDGNKIPNVIVPLESLETLLERY